MAENPEALSPYRVLDLTTEIGQYAGRAFAERLVITDAQRARVQGLLQRAGVEL